MCLIVWLKIVSWIFRVQLGCLLQISLEPLDLGTSSDLLVGQRVFALGNPFGLDHSLTTGILKSQESNLIADVQLPDPTSFLCSER